MPSFNAGPDKVVSGSRGPLLLDTDEIRGAAEDLRRVQLMVRGGIADPTPCERLATRVVGWALAQGIIWESEE